MINRAEVNAVIDELTNPSSYSGYAAIAEMLRGLLAELEAADADRQRLEAKFEESRADNHRMALELADMLVESKEMRARIAELEKQVPKWVPPNEEIRPPLKVMPMPFWRGYVLCANALPAAPATKEPE